MELIECEDPVEKQGEISSILKFFVASLRNFGILLIVQLIESNPLALTRNFGEQSQVSTDFYFLRTPLK